MTKNKNTPENTPKSSFWQRFSLMYLFFLILILLALFVVWKTFETPLPIIETKAPLVEVQKKVSEVSEVFEVAETSQHLVTLQLLQGVLEGWIPLSTFKTYLQNHPNGDAPHLLLELSTLSECPSYSELQSSLSASPGKSKSLWEHLKSLIHIKKINENGAPQTTSREDIEKAIDKKNLSEVLNVFEGLPAEEKEKLLPWKEKVEERFKVEMLYKNLLLKLAQGQQG